MTEPTRMHIAGTALTGAAAQHKSPTDTLADAAASARFKALVDAAALHDSTQGRRPHGDRSLQRQEDRPDTALPYFSLRSNVETAASPVPSPVSARDEIVELLRQFCAALFVGDASSAQGKHVWLALDSSLAGAAAEFIRDGAVLRVNLHARNATTLRLMTAQRDSLHLALANATELSVQVAVIDDEGLSDGSAA
ncbi:MAG: hypothetical protein ABW106_14970 [Steroidobacteraceae bacterium]